MSLASDWLALVGDVQAQEPPRFVGTVVKQARVAANGTMHTQLLQGSVQTNVEIPAPEALQWAQWIVNTFGTPPPP